MDINMNYENYYEIRYIDVNDRSHEEKMVIAFGYNEEEVKEEFMESDLINEKDNVVNEPRYIVTSVTRIGTKTLV